MNTIKIFENEQFGKVRIAMGENNEPFFCLADVCQILDLIPSKVAQRLDKDVLSKYPLETAGGIQQANFVDEDGLYDTILDSRKPEAKKFRKWVTSEVLPCIRKTGGYIATKMDDTPEEIMARALIVAQETLKRKEQRLIEAEQKIQKDAPKSPFLPMLYVPLNVRALLLNWQNSPTERSEYRSEPFVRLDARERLSLPKR